MVRRRALNPLPQILARGPDRPSAFVALASALSTLRVGGLHTNVGLLERLARCDALASPGAPPVDTSFLTTPAGSALLAPAPPPPHALAMAALASHSAAAAAAAAECERGGAWADTNGRRPGTGLTCRRPLVLRDDESGVAATVMVETGAEDGSVRVSCDGVDSAPAHASGADARPSPPPPALDVTLASPTVTPPPSSSTDGLWRVTATDAATGVRVSAVAALGRDADDSIIDVWLPPHHRATLRTPIPRTWGDGNAGGAGTADEAVAPMPGRVARVAVKVGDVVSEGDTLAVVEAMKMEHPVGAPRDGVVARVDAVVGAVVGAGDGLVALENVVAPAAA